MITIFKTMDKEIKIIPTPIEGTWIHAVAPTAEEMDWLQNLGIPKDYPVYALDMDERARTERDNGIIFILLRQPQYQGADVDIPYITVPLGIILTSQYIITVSSGQNETLEMFANGQMRNFSTCKHQRFVLRILLSTASRYLHYLRQITKKVDRLEDQLQLSTRNKELLELLKYQKSLTIFTTALKSNELMLQRLQQMRLFNTYPEDEELLEDVLAETQQAIEMTFIESNILNSMMDAFASIISNNLNSVMKLLASITIMVSLPSTIAAFFGMNVQLPFAGHWLAFALILGISFAITLVAAVFFWKHDWM